MFALARCSVAAARWQSHQSLQPSFYRRMASSPFAETVLGRVPHGADADLSALPHLLEATVRLSKGKDLRSTSVEQLEDSRSASLGTSAAKGIYVDDHPESPLGS
jgi:hypothetical protein